MHIIAQLLAKVPRNARSLCCTSVAYLALALLNSPCAVATALPQGSCDSPLIDAIHLGKTEDAIRLIGAREGLNKKNCEGQTPLSEAIATKNDAMAKELVIAGADVNQQSGRNTTPLMMAAWYCRTDAVLTLLDHGAAVNETDVDGYSALMQASQNCEGGNIPALLLKAGAGINAKAVNGHTALYVASFYGNEQVVYLLVAAGADVETPTKGGDNALTAACGRQAGHKESHDHICDFLRDIVSLRTGKPGTN